MLQIFMYLESRGGVGAGAGGSAGAGASTGSDTCTLAESDYRSLFDQAPSMLELVRNPFILRLFVEALPGIAAAEWDSLTRYKIYNVFVRQWFTREVAKSPDRRTALGITSGVVSEEQALARFEMLSALLAGEMLKADVLEVVVVDVHGGDDVWQRVREVADGWVVEDAVAAVPKWLSRPDRRKAEAVASTAAIAAIDELQASCPLRRSGNSFQFIHKSFFEYFCARLVILAGTAAEDVRMDRLTAALSLPGDRRIQAEPAVLSFLRECWHEADPGLTPSLRDCLLSVVAQSALAQDSSPATESGVDIVSSSANAATILNAVGEPLCDLGWNGVILDGADLSFADLSRSSLRGARLRRCCLEKACLQDVDLSSADLTGVVFRERVPVPVLSDIDAIAWDPRRPGSSIAVATPGSVRFWNTDSNQPSRDVISCAGSWVPGLQETNGGLLSVSTSNGEVVTVTDVVHGWSVEVGFQHHDVLASAVHVLHGGDPPTVLVALATEGGFGVLSNDKGRPMVEAQRQRSAELGTVTCLEFGPWKVFEGGARHSGDAEMEVSASLLHLHSDYDVMIGGGRPSKRPRSIDPSGPVLVSGYNDGAVRVWDPVTMEAARSPWRHPGNGAITCMVFSSGDPVYLVTGGASGSIVSWNSHGQAVSQWNHASGVTCLAHASAGKRQLVACGTKGGDVFLLSVPDLGHVSTYRGQSGDVRSLAFSPSSESSFALASGHSGGILRVWDDVMESAAYLGQASRKDTLLQCRGLNVTSSVGLRPHHLALLSSSGSRSTTEALAALDSSEVGVVLGVAALIPLRLVVCVAVWLSRDDTMDMTGESIVGPVVVLLKSRCKLRRCEPAAGLWGVAYN